MCGRSTPTVAKIAVEAGIESLNREQTKKARYAGIASDVTHTKKPPRRVPPSPWRS